MTCRSFIFVLVWGSACDESRAGERRRTAEPRSLQAEADEPESSHPHPWSAPLRETNCPICTLCAHLFLVQTLPIVCAFVPHREDALSGMTVVELGAAPGGWTVVATDLVRATRDVPWIPPPAKRAPDSPASAGPTEENSEEMNVPPGSIATAEQPFCHSRLAASLPRSLPRPLLLLLLLCLRAPNYLATLDPSLLRISHWALTNRAQQLRGQQPRGQQPRCGARASKGV